MSLFLRFASVIRPRTKIYCAKRFYWTSHGFTFREGLGIRYFLPRTADTPSDFQVEQMKDSDSVPVEFKVIYTFPNQDSLSALSYAALGFAAAFIIFLFKPTFMKEMEENYKKQKEESVSEEPILDNEYISSGTLEKTETVLDSYFGSEVFRSGDPRIKSLAGLSMIIFFFYVRSRCVLTIYRHNDDFITVLNQAVGFGKKLIKHRASDCCYYPKRKWFNHNLMGRDVLIFPELFINLEERDRYIGKTSQ